MHARVSCATNDLTLKVLNMPLVPAASELSDELSGAPSMVSGLKLTFVLKLKLSSKFVFRLTLLNGPLTLLNDGKLFYLKLFGLNEMGGLNVGVLLHLNLRSKLLTALSVLAMLLVMPLEVLRVELRLRNDARELFGDRMWEITWRIGAVLLKLMFGMPLIVITSPELPVSAKFRDTIVPNVDVSEISVTNEIIYRTTWVCLVPLPNPRCLSLSPP